MRPLNPNRLLNFTSDYCETALQHSSQHKVKGQPVAFECETSVYSPLAKVR